MLALCSVRQSRPGPFHHLAQWGGRLLACDTENLIHQATDRDSWACTFNSIEHHFRHDHPVIHAMSPSTRWSDVLRTDVSWKLGAFLRVVEGYVSVDSLHEIEGFQHFRGGDVFQVFSAWVQWLQLEFFGIILLDAYLLDDEVQAQGDVLARLHNHVYDKFGFIAIFTAVDSQTASRPTADTQYLEMLSLVHWASFLLKTNTWFILAGLVRSDQNRQKMYMAGVLEEVRICCTRPSYLCYGTKNEIDLGRTAAVLLHADEGRGRRRQAFMVLSFHSVLGRGTNLANKRSVKKHLLKMKLNFKGHSLCSRMLAAVPPHRSTLDVLGQASAILRKSPRLPIVIDVFSSARQSADAQDAFTLQMPLDEISEDHTSCSLSTASSWDWDNRDGGDADVPAADDPPPWLDNSTSAGGVQAEAALAGGVPSPAVDLPPEPLLGAAAQDGEVQVPHDASAVPVVADVEAGEAHGGARADSGLPSSLPEERAPNGGAGSSSDWVNDLDPPRTNDHRWDAEQWGDWARWEATRPFTAGGSLPLPARDAQHGKSWTPLILDLFLLEILYIHLSMLVDNLNLVKNTVILLLEILYIYLLKLVSNLNLVKNMLDFYLLAILDLSLLVKNRLDFYMLVILGPYLLVILGLVLVWTRKQWEDWETWEDTMRPSLEPDQMNLMQMPGGDGAADEGVSGDALSLALSPAEQQALHDAGWPLVGVERLAAFCDFLDWARGEFGVGAVAWAMDAWGDALVMGNTTIELAQETLWERLRDVPVERPEDDGRPPTTVAS
eukprot:s8491_g1.t1